MPSLIDSLFIEIGLDPSKYVKGAKEITDADKRVRDLMLSSGKAIEEQSKKSGDSILSLKSNVLGLFAAFTGIGVAAFTQQLIHTDAATGRAAKSFGISTNELSKWEIATKLAGGTAEDAKSTISGLTLAIEKMKVTRDPSAFRPWVQWLGIDPRDENGG